MLWVVIGILLKILVVVSIALGTVAYLIYVERKVAAYAQDRVGPNRAGKELGIPFGLLQPLADGAKMVLKEDVIPGYVSRPLYMLAPMIAIVAAMIGFAVVPFGPVGPNQIMNFQIAPNINIGILYVFAIGSLAVYGVILAGWASNNKYAFIGALRSSAQLISYEIPLAMSILGMVLIAGSLDLNQIVNWQDRQGLGRVRPADRVLALPGQRLRRDQPAAVRPARVGAGAGRRLSHRVFGHEVRHVLPGRIPARDHRELPDGHPVLRRLGPSLRPRSEPDRVRQRGAQGDRAAGQGRPDDPLHHVGAVDPAAVPLRPAHGPGLEVAHPAGPGQPGGHGRDRATDLLSQDRRIPESTSQTSFPKESDRCEPTTRN